MPKARKHYLFIFRFPEVRKTRPLQQKKSETPRGYRAPHPRRRQNRSLRQDVHNLESRTNLLHRLEHQARRAKFKNQVRSARITAEFGDFLERMGD